MHSSLTENRASVVVCRDLVSPALSRSVTHFLPVSSDSSFGFKISSAVIFATMRHDLVPQPSGGEQSPSILRFSSPPAHPTTGEFTPSVVRLIAPPTSMITFSRDFVRQSDWYRLWQVAEVDSFCSGCCQGHSSLVFLFCFF